MRNNTFARATAYRMSFASPSGGRSVRTVKTMKEVNRLTNLYRNIGHNVKTEIV